MNPRMIALLLLTALRGCESPPAHRALTSPHQVRTVVFYNVENLFDTLDDPLTGDDDRTPEGRDRWTQERYDHKLSQIARVLGQLGGSEARPYPDLIGLCEIENRKVLEDLRNQSGLRQADYGIVHFDGPDHRGIDVALLYRKDVFTVVEQESRRLILQNARNQRKYTRDQLVVFGFLDGDPLYLSVNHWPSRSGGQTSSEPYRRQAAALQRSILDSVLRMDPDARFISMGDFNDEPTDISLRHGLGTREYADSLPSHLFFNPMLDMYRDGAGSLAYRDRWSLFDQILFNGNWFPSPGGFRYWKAGIYSAPYLRNPDGPYKGYPFRTYVGGQYRGGFSDHFPVYAVLIRPEKAATVE